jgi:hypothetical protein
MVDLNKLNGHNGFCFKQYLRHFSGAGDVNADGIDDLAFAVQYSVHPGVKWADLGELDVIFGRKLGDVNCDARVDAFDIDPFVEALVDFESYKLHYPGCDPARCDINADGMLDAFDIDPFVQALVRAMKK